MTTPPVPSGPDPRPGRVVYAIALTVVAAGLLYLGVAPQHWLRGVLVVSAGLTFAGLARWLLPDRRSGPLLVRGRWFDGGCFVVVGIATAFFGFLVR